MRFLSVCSGIEAASVAWNPLGWRAVAFSEIEPFPCAVLAHHYPDIPNWGDMTKFQEWPDEPIDLLCGGTPCQSFSVAGLRKGLDDPRGNLMLTFGAIAAKYRPRWLVWENVPGVLSSNRGRDFGAFLRMLGQLGYGFAYRVLDAQYFGVPQRRRRVFVVGCLGDWRAAAAVLFERHSLSGDPAPRRETGQGLAADIAPSLVSSGRGVEQIGETRDQDPVIAVDGCGASLMAFGGNNTAGPIDVATALNVCASASGRMDFDSETFIAHSLRGEGFDASEDGTGRGTPIIPVPFDTTQITSKGNYSRPRAGDPCHPLAAGAHAPAIAFDCKSSGQNGFGVEVEMASTLRAMSHAGSHANGGGHQAVAVALRGREAGATAEMGDEVGHALRASTGGGDKPHVLAQMQVRRLTPEECEALQAFPRNYTRIPWKAGYWPADKHSAEIRDAVASMCPDGPRYKALGNSWCVTNVRWIGERIQQVNQILESR
ncbi:DNA cytosine methyltransferase [Alcaligenes sp. WGS1538]|uniref:DNA cytosine methyltransferase n=1 Tax=Alcaligenes sp. WGS1538 TaxID=3366811 RepID=UPI00372D1F38